MLWIERKWIDLVSPQLDRFKWKSDTTANFRCPICGDSEKDKRKARAYLIVHKGQYFMKCHNCGVSMSFKRFLKSEFPETYSQYQMDLMKEKSGTVRKTEDSELSTTTGINEKLSKKTVNNNIRQNWVYLNDLPEEHAARRYLDSRQLPESALSRIVYTDDFCQWVIDNSGLKKYQKRLPHDKRILFPIIGINGEILGVQGRVIGDVKSNTLRYITIKFQDTYSKLYGLDRIDFDNYPVLVVEGPLDSLFLPNAIALCGGDVPNSLSKYKENIIIALDNEPRNRDTIERMKDAIDQGYNIVIWNSTDIPSKYKDINDMIVKGGMTPETILNFIHQNASKGMMAKLSLATWKKV